MKTKTRGLEPIVAAVLLIVVAVIGAVLIYLWFAGYVTKATSQADSMAASEKLKIEAASLTAGASPGVALYVRNLGGDTARIVHAYVFRPGTLSAICSHALDPPSTIQPGAMSSVTFTIPSGSCTGSVNAGYDYVIKIITQKGTELAVTVTASS
jgi:archaellum component FlaF (FlaF/FlaG flagellin family)